MWKKFPPRTRAATLAGSDHRTRREEKKSPSRTRTATLAGSGHRTSREGRGENVVRRGVGGQARKVKDKICVKI